MKQSIACLALLGAICGASAGEPRGGVNRLVTVSEWNQACARLGGRDVAADCRARIHRAAYGRSLGPFDLITPADRNLLQSRSGVLLRNELNHRIIQVKEDSGLRTIVQLEDDVQCQTYVAAPDLVGTPRTDRAYAPLIDSWLHTYTDAKGRVRAVRVGRHNGKPALRFDAALDNNRALHGAYALDESANAGIFATCDFPMTSFEAQETARQFFDSIVGSARRYM